MQLLYLFEYQLNLFVSHVYPKTRGATYVQIVQKLTKALTVILKILIFLHGDF